VITIRNSVKNSVLCLCFVSINKMAWIDMLWFKLKKTWIFIRDDFVLPERNQLNEFLFRNFPFFHLDANSI